MRIGVCQTSEILGDVDAAVKVVQRFAEHAAAAEVDLLLFSECFLQGYLLTEGHVHGQAFEIGSADFDTVLARLEGLLPVLVLGMIERSGHRYYNTAAVIDSGRVIGRYRKTFLTSGESIFQRPPRWIAAPKMAAAKVVERSIFAAIYRSTVAVRSIAPGHRLRP